ncbi:hypothetical protein ACFX2G_044735 [Malus domestica]
MSDTILNQFAAVLLLLKISPNPLAYEQSLKRQQIGEKKRAFDDIVNMLMTGFTESLESKMQYLKPSEKDSLVIEG